MTPRPIPVAFLILVLLPSGTAVAADGWSVLIEPMYMDAYGHDQHILTIHEIAPTATPPTDTKTPVTLDSEDGPGYRFELHYARDAWTYGLDFFWFNSSQGRPARTGAGAGPGSQLVFEMADRTVTADAPNETLSFAVLEDTDLAAWAVDLYVLRNLLDSADRRLHLQFGLRNADFDNDFRGFMAVDNVGGSRLDASSNYPRMIGPIVGIAGDVRLGRGSLASYFGQSVVFGEAELRHMTRDFSGAFGDTLNVVAAETFDTKQDVAIPITDFRVRWLYPVSSRVSLGLSANTSLWWDVPVPPGVIPLADGDEAFHENTLLYFGLGVSVLIDL